VRRTSSVRLVAAGMAVLVALSLLACSGDDGQESAVNSTTTEAVSDSPTTSSDDGESSATADEQGVSGSNGSAKRCAETENWTTGPEQVQAGIADPIYLLDAGRHDAPECYDQLSFRLNGTGGAGYYVGYADGSDVRVEGDQSVKIAGDAALVVDISAPVQGGPFDKSGHAPGAVFAETVGQTLYPVSNPSGLEVIKEVRFAGELESGSEPGSVASFAVGVDRQRPFAVSSLVDGDSNTRVIVIRVAH
jgi:hypothetical protein